MDQPERGEICLSAFLLLECAPEGMRFEVGCKLQDGYHGLQDIDIGDSIHGGETKRTSDGSGSRIFTVRAVLVRRLTSQS